MADAAITSDVVANAWAWVLNPVRFGALILPGGLVSCATLVRWALGLAFTSWADALLAFVAFDATVIVDNENFRSLFNSPAVASHIVGIHLVFLAGASISWIMLVWRAEKHLAIKQGNHHSERAAHIATGAGVAIVALFIVLHTVTYTSKG